MSDGMTKKERGELVNLVKSRARLAKVGVETRKAELLANFEAQMARVYDPQEEAFQDITKEALELARRAEAHLAQRCAEFGIPERFRSGLHTYWSGRGENGFRERRTELRRVTQSRLDADARRAKLQIDVAAQELQEKLVVGALESAEARGFLEAMPMPETMMAALSLAALEASLGN